MKLGVDPSVCVMGGGQRLFVDGFCAFLLLTRLKPEVWERLVRPRAGGPSVLVLLYPIQKKMRYIFLKGQVGWLDGLHRCSTEGTS